MAPLHISAYFLRQKEEGPPSRKYTMSKGKALEARTFVGNIKYFFMSTTTLK